MAAFFEDLRYAVRGLSAARAFALTAIAMLALGIGANAAMFTLAGAVLFDGFPSIEGNDRLVYVASDRSACCLSYPDFEDWRRDATAFEDLAAVRGVSVSVSGTGGLAESREATEVSAGTFELVGRKPILGRGFSAADELPGAAPVALLSHTFWMRRFDADPAIVGQSLRIDGSPTTVIGVMPEGFAFPQKQDLWLPLVPTPELRQRDARNLWFAFGRIAEGATLEQARAQVTAIGRTLAQEYPDTNRGYMPAVRTFAEFFIGPNERLAYASMWGGVAFVLLIVCVNLAILMLARAADQAREIAVRMALGAGPWRVVRQLVLESLLVSAAGAAVGWWIAKWAVLAGAAAERGPGLAAWRVLDFEMDYEALAFVVATTVGTALLFGLAPARQLLRLDLSAALRAGGRGSSAAAARKGFVVTLLTVNVALAAVLLVSAAVTTRGWLAVSAAETGVEAQRVLTGLVQPPAERYRNGEAREKLFEELALRVAALPDVESVAFASVLPTWGARLIGYETPEMPAVAGGSTATTGTLVVSPRYFSTLGAAVVAGRDFVDTDDAGTLPVALVNELFAARQWPGENAIGKRLRLLEGAGPNTWLTVVGVVSNIVQADATRQSFDRLVYVPHRQAPRTGLWVVARTRGAPFRVADELRGELAALDADLPLALGPYALEDRMAEIYWNSELYAWVFIVFAALALLLATFGLYSTLSYVVSRDVHEIGVRMAIGANAHDVLLFVLKWGMRPLALGLPLGLALSLVATRLLSSAVPVTTETDALAWSVLRSRW